MRKIVLLLAILLIGNSAFASVAVRYGDNAVLVGEDGTIFIKNGVYSDIEPIGNDLFAVRQGNRYALADNYGSVLTDFEYTQMEVCGEMVCVGVNGAYGLIDLQGKALTNDRVYSKIVMDVNGFAWALRSDGDQLILLMDGTDMYAPLGEVDAIADVPGDGLLAVRMADSMLWGYCNRNGRMVIRDSYEYADTFNSGLARVVVNGAFGVIDETAAEVVPCAYERLEMNPYMIAGQNGSAAVIYDHTGKETARYDDAVNGFVLLENKYAIFSAEDVRLYTCGGELIESFSAQTQLIAGIDGGIIVSEGLWGENGVYLYGGTETWQDISPLGFVNGKAVYRAMKAEASVSRDGLLDEEIYSIDPSDMRFTIVSETGEAITEGEWKSIQYLADDRFLAETETELEMIDTEGNIYFVLEKKVK